jgi:microcin C transport system permease protein
MRQDQTKLCASEENVVFVYLARRFLLLIPTLFGITLITFVLINLAPGGPVEQKIQQMRMGGDGGGGRSMGVVNQQVLDALKKQYGFDKPLHMRYLIWLKNIVHMDFGDSFVYEEPVVDVIKSKFPVSLQFGIVSLILTYSVCIPLGIRKAIKVGSRFDQVSTVILNATYAIPTLVMGIYLITVFSGKLNWFPVGNLYSDDYESLTTGGKIWKHLKP